MFQLPCELKLIQWTSDLIGFRSEILQLHAKISESEHADIDIGNQVADNNLEMLPYNYVKTK